MGRKGNTNQLKSKSKCDDDDSVGQCSMAMSNLKLKPNSIKQQTSALEGYLELLFEKRGSTKEKALSLIADSFKNNIQHRFVSNKCITLLHRCLNSIKLGSTREICLASHVIGLLSITVGCTDGLAHEILQDSVPILSKALQSSSEQIKLASLLDCLAIITFVGGNNAEETERSMQVIWQFIQTKSGPHVSEHEQTSQALTAAISSWSFLLATMDSWRISSKLWRESVSYFLKLLSNKDLSLRMAVGEALALIFEIGNPTKFFDETKESEGQVISVEGLKGRILDQLGILSVEIESDNESVEKPLFKSYQTLLHDVTRVVKGCYSPDSCIRIGGDVLKISTWSHLVQVNYLKRFLGVGFVKHAKENELLQDFLEFTPKRNNKQLLCGKQYMNSDEKESIRYLYQPEVKLGDDLTQRKLYSGNSVINKAKTQLRNKKRMLSQAKNDGHFAVSFGDDDS